MFNSIQKTYRVEVKRRWEDVAFAVQETKEAVKKSRIDTNRSLNDSINNYRLEDKALDLFFTPYDNEEFNDFKYRFDEFHASKGNLETIQYLLNNRDLVENQFRLYDNRMGGRLLLRTQVREDSYASVIYVKKNFMFRGEKITEHIVDSLKNANIPYYYNFIDGLLL